MEETNDKNKTMVWVAVGCIAIVACILVVILLCFGSLLLLGIQQIPDNNFNIEVNGSTSYIANTAQYATCFNSLTSSMESIQSTQLLST